MQGIKRIRIIALAVAFFFAAPSEAQILTRGFVQVGEGPYHHGISYRAVKIAEEDEYSNVYWKRWLIDDIKAFEEDNVLDMDTQEGYGNDGRFLSPIVDSIYFNHAAAQHEKTCPAGWRLPRIGEFDTLMLRLTYDQRAYMFMNGRGFRGYTSEIVEGRLAVKRQLLKGGFWWCAASDSSDRAYVVTVGDNNFYEVGLADVKDLASVRCVSDDSRLIKKEDDK